MEITDFLNDKPQSFFFCISSPSISRLAENACKDVAVRELLGRNEPRAKPRKISDSLKLSDRD